jgi:phosphatidylserine decarboxylase
MNSLVEQGVFMRLTKIIHADGWKFIASFAAVTVCLFLLSTTLGWLGLLLTGWCIYFFRDPERVTPVGDTFVISPADGVVQAISAVPPPREVSLAEHVATTRISIFLNVFDVHVNRVPADGKILQRHYHAGQFLNASLDKASDLNERQTFVMETAQGLTLVFVQIAGLIARRICSDVEVGEEVRAGQRFGIIRFGSRMDVYLPQGVAAHVCVGQRVIAGETILADLENFAAPRIGEIR